MKPIYKHLLIILLLLTITIGLRLFFQYGNIPKEDKPYYQDEQGYLYLQQYDPYVYYIQAKENPSGFSLFLSYWHNLLSIFRPNISLSGSMGYSPLLFISLAVITLYFILFYITKAIYPSIYGSLLFAINPFIFKGSYIGYADTNSANIFLSILITFIYFLTTDKKKWSYLLLLVAIWLFSWFWSGWWYILVIMLIGSIIYILIENLLIPIIKKEFKVKTHWKYIFILLIVLSVFAIFFAKHYPHYSNYIIKENKIETNYNQIAELRGYIFWPFLATSLPYFLLFAIPFSVIYTYKHHKDRKIWFLLVFFLSTAIISTQGVRFIYFALIPYYIFAGLIIYDLNIFIFKLNKKYIYLFILIVFIFAISLNICKKNYDIVGNNKFTIVNDDIYYSLKEIDTDKDLIVFWDKFFIVYSITNKIPEGGTTNWVYGINDLIEAYTTENISYSNELFNKINYYEPYILIIFPYEHDVLSDWNRTGVLKQFTNLTYTENSFLAKHRTKDRRVRIYEPEKEN